MPEIEGLHVFVEVEGKRVDEYAVERSDSEGKGSANGVTCYIPCEAGKVGAYFCSHDTRIRVFTR